MAISAMHKIWEAVSDVCHKHRIVWNDPAKYAKTMGIVDTSRIKRGPKYIIGVNSPDEAAQAETELRTALEKKECLVSDYARQEREKLPEAPKKPYALKIRIINADPNDTMVLGRTPVIASVVTNRDGVHSANKQSAEEEVLLAKRWNDDNPTGAQKEINVIMNEYYRLEKEINKKLKNSTKYRVSWVKPMVYAYRLNYYDPADKRRHQVSVGDVLIAINGGKVEESSARKLRNDRNAVRSDVIMHVWRCTIRPYVPRKRQNTDKVNK